MIADEKVGPRGVKVKCKKCGNMIVVKPQAADAGGMPEEQTTVGGTAAAAQGGELGGAFQSMFTSGASQGAPDPSGYGGSTTTYSAAQLAALQQAAARADAGASAGESSGEPGNGDAGFGSSSFGSSDTTSSDTASSGGYAPQSFGNEETTVSTPPADTPAGSDGADSAFGFPSSPSSGGGETDFAIGALGQQPQQPAPSGHAAGEKEWYVAIDEAQVGPLNVVEIEEKWDNREIDEDSLVWKAGQADWLPLADVAELAYLITERPQQARAPAHAAMTAAAASSGGPAVGTGLSAASFAAPQALEAEPSWRPSAASALSSLVQEELVAKKPEEKEESRAPKGMEGLGLPNMGAADIFGSGSGGTPISMNMPSAPPAADPFATSGSPAWSVPESRPSGGGHGLKIAVIALVVLLIGGVGAGGFFMFQAQQRQAAEDRAERERLAELLARQAAAPSPAPQPAAAAPAAAPAADPNAVAAANGAAPTAAATPDKNEREKSKAKTGRTEKQEREAEAPKVAAAKTKTKVEKDPLDDIDSAAAKPATSDKDLTKDDIVNGVRSNGAKLGPCLTAARSKNEVQPGKITFVLDWTIQPTGAVTGAKLKGPAEVMGTSLPGCFGRVMGSWKFPASKKGAPVANFPLPITVR